MRTNATLILFLVPGIFVQAQGPTDAVRTASSAQVHHSLFGDLTMGISNYGMAVELKMYYRSGDKFFSGGYYQSHVCTAGDYDGIPPWNTGGVTHHVSIHSYSAGFGYMLRGKLKQGISAGISISKINDELTDPILNDFSIDGLSREIAGNGFEEHSHGKHSKIVPGIPIEYKVFLFDRRTIGLDMAFKVDLNMTKIFSAITVGARIGKLAR